MYRGVVLAIFVILGAVPAAYAHAHVESSQPKAGEVLAVAPQNVSITFSEALRPKESYIKVYNPAHKAASGRDVTASNNHYTLSVPLLKRDPGTYTVMWKAVCLCADHHVTKGSFKFIVKSK